jgi:hypothetical protein
MTKNQTAIYIVSSESRSKINEYKIGKHTGDQKKLESRYSTYIIDPIVYYFKYFNSAEKYENKILFELADYRIKNSKGSMTEWIRMDINELINRVNDTIEKIKNEENDLKNETFSDNDSDYNTNDDSDYNTNDDSDYNTNDDFKFNDTNNAQYKIYRCERCKKIFDRKSNYTNHINRKNKCKYNSKTSKKINPSCPNCCKEFSRKYSVDRHLKVCKGDLTKTKGKINYNIKISGNNNNTKIDKSKKIINNINIISLNFPPDKYTLSEDLDKILSTNNDSVIEIVKKTNVKKNKSKHNIYSSNKNSLYDEIYMNGRRNRINTRNVDEILNMILQTKTEDLNDFLNEMGDILKDETKEKIKQAIKKFYDTKSRKTLKSHLKIILFDNKDMVKKTKKLAKYISDNESDEIDISDNENDNESDIDISDN